MARLNEPPVLGDSLEALKRRFIRQNREIARANSTQSTKIRALECEASRLLSENVTLREENIRLQKALEDSQRQPSARNLLVLKDKFESKISELNDLLAEFADAADARESNTSDNEARRKSHRKSLYQRHRPSAEELAEIAIAEGRLPPIVEDSLSPIRALSTAAFQVDVPHYPTVTNSPELGPPPSAHFEEGDPIKRSTTRRATATGSPPKATSTDVVADNETDFLPANLETRRHRRDKETKPEIIHETDVKVRNQPHDSGAVPAQALKAGAKRKFGSREEESRPLVKAASQQDLSGLRRRGEEEIVSFASSRSKSHVNLSSLASSMSKSHSKPSASIQGRKALGEKNVNTDPVVSPIKARASATDKPSDLKKEDPTKPRDRSIPKEKSVIRQIRPIKPSVETLPLDVVEVHIPPVTPAPLGDDVFSPDSRPSTTRPESRDTPPPTDLDSSDANAAARPSRRQRGAVSYAEPNLRDKMRRPGKEMVDAISGLQRSRMSMSDLPQEIDQALNLSIPKFDSKVDAPSHPHEGREPASPLTSRSSTLKGSSIADQRTLPTSTIADRRRRSLAVSKSATSAAEATSSEGQRISASQETIAALISSSNKKLARLDNGAYDAPPSQSEVSNLVESLSVFDLHLSSPQSASIEEQAETKQRPARGLKRHSSASEGLSVLAKDHHGKDAVRKRVAEEMDHLALGAESKPDLSQRRAERAERRRSMMV